MGMKVNGASAGMVPVAMFLTTLSILKVSLLSTPLNLIRSLIKPQSLENLNTGQDFLVGLVVGA